METQEFFKNWKNKYLKSWKNFLKFINKNFNINKFNIDTNSIKMDSIRIYFEFEMLTGIINKFYFENGIILIENYDRKTKKYLKTIFSGRNLENEIDINDNENYKELNYDCFLYAAEILEKELS